MLCSPVAADRAECHRQRASGGFILGGDDSDDDDMLDSASDASSEGVGAANTAMNFMLDEDSGLGFSTSPSGDDESAERFEQPAELVPMRPMVVGGSLASRGVRKTKLHFNDFYRMGNDHLGSGAYASVRTATSISTGKEYAVKLVGKHEPGHTRSRILREVETFKMCKNHPNIVQLIEWFEDENYFYMVFEKVRGGPLLSHIQRKVCFTEQEASQVTKEIATALKYLHDRGIAHRDIKPENILCMDPERVSPIKICDLDLASKPHVTTKSHRPLPTVHSEPDLASPVGSAEFMAPEVVDAFVGDALKYDKRCDMWSLGVIIYIMLCGYPPFYGECDRDNCGWDQGEQCTDCQESLFHRIQRGDFDFPVEEWGSISREAKDLISHLLVKNVRQRYTADDVLKHPWVVKGAPNTPLLTANNLFRNDSTRDMHQMQEHFNVMNRFNAARLSTRMESSNGASPEVSAPTSPVTEEPPKLLTVHAENAENAPPVGAFAERQLTPAFYNREEFEAKLCSTKTGNAEGITEHQVRRRRPDTLDQFNVDIDAAKRRFSTTTYSPPERSGLQAPPSVGSALDLALLELPSNQQVNHDVDSQGMTQKSSTPAKGSTNVARDSNHSDNYLIFPPPSTTSRYQTTQHSSVGSSGYGSSQPTGEMADAAWTSNGPRAISTIVESVYSGVSPYPPPSSGGGRPSQPRSSSGSNRASRQAKAAGRLNKSSSLSHYSAATPRVPNVASLVPALMPGGMISSAAPIFAALGGQWRLTRRITDRLLQLSADAEGSAIFSPEPTAPNTEMHYAEQVIVRWANGVCSPAAQRYWYHLDNAGDAVEQYGDVGPDQLAKMHTLRFEPRGRTNLWVAESQFVCGNTLYKISYGFSGSLDRFHVDYEVQGPQMNYSTFTVYCKVV